MQGTDAELQDHRDECVTNHLELTVEHTAQAELDVVRIKGQTQVSYLYTWIDLLIDYFLRLDVAIASVNCRLLHECIVTKRLMLRSCAFH